MDDGTRADVRFVISEGPQVFVDHVIIVGNRRTSTSTITREILMKPGGPLGYSARIETQQRLVALGLFRRVVVDELRHAGEARRDVIIRVEESPPTTIGYGGGVEGGTRLRPTGESGQAEERFEMAPRGFFEIGRRNLWGKNRAVNLFTRVSLRSRDIVAVRRRRSAGGARRMAADMGSTSTGWSGPFASLAFSTPTADATPDWHHRPGDPVELQFREASGARRGGEPAVAAIQRGRPLFVPRSPGCSTSDSPKKRNRSSTGCFRRYDCQNSPDPSSATHGATWSIPSEGTFVIVDGEVAPRAIGSEVGFIKTFLQGFRYIAFPLSDGSWWPWGRASGLREGCLARCCVSARTASRSWMTMGIPSWTSCMTCRRANGFSRAAIRRFADSPSIGWGPTRRSVRAVFQPAETASSSSTPNCGALSSVAWAWWVS